MTFYIWQLALIVFAVVAAHKDGLPGEPYRRKQPGNASLRARRNDVRISTLTGYALGAVGFVLAVVSFADESALSESMMSFGERFIWAVVDLGLVGYLFGFNVWFRDLVHRFDDRIHEERR